MENVLGNEITLNEEGKENFVNYILIKNINPYKI